MKQWIAKFALLGATLACSPLAADNSVTESAGQESPEATALKSKGYSRGGSAITDVDSGSFSQLLATSSKPIILVITADWCAPCKKLKPILDEIAAQTPEITFVRANFDSNRGLASNYGVGSIPTVLYMQPGGRIVDTTVGFLTKQEIIERIQRLLVTAKN